MARSIVHDNVHNPRCREALVVCLMLLGATWPARCAGFAKPAFSNAVVLAVQNKVEVARRFAQVWDPAYVTPTNQILFQGDRLRTGVDSRALLRLSNLTDFPVGELTEVEIPLVQAQRTTIKLWRGVLYFFHRDRRGEFQVDTPTVSAVVRGTEFNVEVAADGTTTFRLVDGAVEMANAFGRLELRSGEEGVAAAGQAPRRTAVIMTHVANVIQWCLYYPGVLHLDELDLSVEERNILRDSLEAYRSGDLLAALTRYPAGRQAGSDPERIYRAAILLAVGKVSESEKLLDALTAAEAKPLEQALRTLMAAVKSGSNSYPSAVSTSPSLALAESYRLQSRFQLAAARAQARHAVELAPGFAFAWTQLAELEFAFGRTPHALAALEKSLQLAPRNAQALALKGFLLAAQSRITQAEALFNQAILMDGALGNAWLGRGLCRIRQGQSEAGLADLEVAATLEPQRAALRSYLGKAFSLAGDQRRALHELELARALDAGDPTPWLYSALIKQEQNRINEAVRDLEKSESLNDNRRVYRSRLLLDEDRAVRGANLATIYQDANMIDVSQREAARAINADYADYSAHLFLGGTYDALRDPRQFNLRYETPWLSEYLVANLLAPAAAGTLSPLVTQQEYGRLFERDRVGLSSETEYWSRGDWVENAVHYGIFGNTSYALEAAYRSENGERPNNDLEEVTATIKAKQQVTSQDSVFLQASYFNAESGDLAQYFYQTNAHAGLRVKETQEPLLLAGWHHEWSPGSHTLLLGGHWQDTLRTSDPAQEVLFLRLGGGGVVNGVPSPALPTAPSNYRSDFDGYTAELQQIFRAPRNSIVLGARFQTGTFDTRSDLGPSTLTAFAIGGTLDPGLFSTPAVSSQATADFQRLSFYAYDYAQLLETVWLTAGVSYDRLYSPLNFQYSPISGGHETTEQVSPKGGLIWQPLVNTTLRAAYSQALGGVSFDQSFRLEPSQVAGFNQAFRSLIPESVAGALASPEFEIRAASVEQKLGRGTYLGAQAEWLSSSVERRLGTIDLAGIPNIYVVSNTRQKFDFDEKNLILTLNQLLGNHWSLGGRYRLSDARLQSRLEDIPTSVSSAARDDVSATLQQATLFALFNHPSGFFGQFDSIWSHQSSRHYVPDLPSTDFWQLNLSGGWRFWQRRVEARLSLLNLADRNYQLNPLNLTSDLPRHRTLVVSLRMNF